VESLEKVLHKFYGNDPQRSPDLSRIVNSKHFKRLRGLMDDEEMVSDKVVFGGQSDELQL
jgi:aldehyde dehydrogenase (NAD+)